MKRLFSLTRALVARKRKIFALFFALAASIGMMNAKVTWNSSNISDLNIYGTDGSYSKEGVTLSTNGDMIDARWYNYGDESKNGISFDAHQTGGFTFSNTLGKNFTKIEMTLNGPGIWDMSNLGSGWSFSWEPSEDNHATATWTGNASTVDLLKEASDFPGGEPVRSIVFYFEGDSEAPDPTYTIALEDGTVNADKVTLSATSAVEGATVTVTPNEEYEITAFSATYAVVEGSLGTIYEIDATLDPATGAYSFAMPAANVTIDATIAAKPVPEGDIFAGFTATAGSGGFTNEGHANLVDGKFTSAEWTKWCTNNDHRSVPTGESGDACWWIDFEASAALNLTGYILTTGNDSGNEHGRNPKNWLLKAKLNADDAWTTIATVTGDVTMKNQNFKDYKFFVDQSGSYKYFRFEVFANQGANVMQLCELRLIGTEASAPAGGGSTDGALSGAFTVNSGGDQVYFSKGNLQATTTDLGEHWSWDFAEHQWDIIGNAAANNSINGNGTVSANGTVDMFGWSTSANYYGINNSQDGTDYAGDFKDWGETIDDGWRTLTFAEWRYLLDYRAGTRYCKATVNSKTGLVIFPDNYSHPAGVTDVASANTKNADFATNSWSGDDWTNMETAGAVFLPMAGCRFGTSFMFQSTNGFYWSSTPYGDDQIYRLNFKSSDMDPASWYARYGGMFVRLVYEAPAPAGPIPCTAADLGKVLCTDGSIYATVSEATAAGKTAAAVIAYVDTENGKALALALADDSDETLDWATAKTTAAAHTPAVSGGTWTLASQDDWNNMITAAGGYEALRDGFSAVGGTNMRSAWYWSSTSFSFYAWCYQFNNGEWFDDYQDGNNYVRACLAFDIPAAPAYETVMNLINAIGTVELTAECKAKIDEARAAYDALSDGDKAQVTNITTLTQAETDYAALAAAAAAPVIAQIEALPTAVKLSTYFSTYDLMVAARAAYNALSAEVQAAVTNLSKLTNLEAAFAAIGGVNEKLSKPFSVGEGQVVYFSHGNLQATYNGSNWSWAFAAHQYEYIGDASGNIIINGNGTLSGAGTVDLFGWVANSSTVLTSGVAKYGVSNSDNVGDYGLGTTETLKGDWGVAANDANIGGYNDWRILSKDEWVYLFKTRTDAASKYGYATVGGVNGVIIIPDAFTDPMKNKGNLAFRPQNVDKGYSTNVYTSGGDWEAMEAAGAVFMPAAGRRYGTTMTVNEGTGFYWSSTPMSYQASYFMGFMGSNVVPDNDRYRSHGLSVRLVSNNAPVASTPLDSARVVKDLIEAIPAEITLEDACVKAINDAREAYNKLSEAAKGLLDEATIAKLTDAEAALTALNQVEADKVVAKINEIPSPMTAENTKLSVYQKVQDARAAYDALTAEQQALVPTAELQKLTDAEAAFAAIGGGGAPAGALNGKFTINAGGDQIAFAKGNLQATTTDLGANWTWGFAANQWNYLGIAVANSKINGNGTVSENGTVDLFGWSTAATYYGINNSYKAVDYIGDFVDWGPNMGAGWRTLTKDEWAYLLQHSSNGKATVNDKNGYIFLPDNWSGPAFTANPDNFTTNVYSGDDWTAMENAGAVFLPSGPARNGTYALIANDAKYCSSTSLNNDTSYVFTIYYNQSQSACTGTNRAYGCMVRLVTEGAPSPLADAQAALDKINAIPDPVVYTPECSAAIKAAREAVDALGANASLLDDADLQKLTDAETAYAGLLAQAVASVKAQIDALPATPLQDADKKLSEYNKVKAAREAYDALSDEEKAAVDNYSKLTDAEAAFAAISGGTKPVNIVWDINTGINEVAINTTSPAYEGITVTTGKGNRFYQTTVDPIMLRFFFSGSAGRYAFAQEDGSHFTKVVLISSVAMGTWLREPSRIGTDWVVSDDYKKATWIGDADTVKIWDGASATAWVDVDSIVFTVNGTATPLADAQAAVDLINEIPSPVVLSDECKAKIDAAREAVTALGENASLIDDADITKLTTAEAAFALLIKDATEVVTKIDAIGEVTFSADCKAKIVAAREAYDALSNELKPYVSNLEMLNKAEADYEAARPFATVTTVPAAVEALQYTGAAQALITAGAAEHGTVLYSLDGENYSTELPTALLAGAYTIYYKVQATDDYKDVAPATIIATIAYNYPATYSLFGIPEGWSVKVNDEEVAVVNGAVKNIAANDRFDIMPVKPEDVKLVEVVPYLLDLATVTDSVIYLMNGDSITGTANGHITVVIVPDAKVYFKDVHLTNTGSHPAVLCGGNAEMVVVGENTISCTTEGEYGIRTAGAGTTLTISGDKTHLSANIDSNGGTVNQ